MQKKFRLLLEITVGDLSDEQRLEEASGMDIPLSELETLEDTNPITMACMFMEIFDNIKSVNNAMFEGSDLMAQIIKVESLHPLERVEWITNSKI
jgi:hypothetical protein